MEKRGLMERLNTDGVICAEGYLFEMERRGYLTAGEFVPEVALEHPDALQRLHKDFQHAGSDVMQAFTYNAHREKLRIIEKEDILEELNRAALRIAREVAEAMGRRPAASRYAANMRKHFMYGDDDRLPSHMTAYGDKA